MNGLTLRKEEWNLENGKPTQRAIKLDWFCVVRTHDVRNLLIIPFRITLPSLSKPISLCWTKKTKEREENEREMELIIFYRQRLVCVIPWIIYKLSQLLISLILNQFDGQRLPSCHESGWIAYSLVWHCSSMRMRVGLSCGWDRFAYEAVMRVACECFPFFVVLPFSLNF